MSNLRLTCVAFLASFAASTIGCASDPDNPVEPSLDGGGSDGGSDGGRDGGHDSGADSGVDSGSDSGPGCTTAANCPAPSSACVERTCKTGVCGEQPKAAGTAVDDQVAGDCKSVQCDGAGKVVTVNDDADVPVDNKDCTDDVCTNGVPSNPAKTVGTACGAGAAMKCDGAGACVGCLSANDCAGQDTECSTRTCNAGVCGTTLAPSGTQVGAQTAGDCKKVVCDGAGATTTQNDDADVPVDNNSCTNDVCTNGVLSNLPVTNGTGCGGNRACFNGTCGGCDVATDCPGTDTDCSMRSCVANQCGASLSAAGTLVAVQQPGDCRQVECDGQGGTTSAIDNADVPDDANACTDDVCNNGVASHTNVAYGGVCHQNGGTFCNGSGLCISAECDDGVQNGSETGVDCGGGCTPCVLDVTVIPADAATNVAVASTIELTFATVMTPATLTTQPNAGPCSGSIQVSSDNFATCIGLAAPVIAPGDTNVTVTPAAALAHATTYRVKVTTDAKKADGTDITAYTMPTGFTTSCSGSAVVISQLFGAGGNSGSVLKADFVELHNRSNAEVDLTGWSVQYTSTTGNFSAGSNFAALSGKIAPGGYFLITGDSGANGAAMPTADLTSTLTMSQTNGKVALVSSMTPLGSACSGATVVDIVAFGPAATCGEGNAPTPVISTTRGAMRKGDGCTDTNNNAADFDIVAPVPRNKATPAAVCVCAP